MKLFYSFDRKIGVYEEYDYIVDMYRASMTLAKKHGYEINFYGDSETIESLKDLTNRNVCTDDVKFDVVDDLKLYVHRKEGLDCITVDGDIFIGKRGLPDMSEGDVWFDMIEDKKNAINFSAIPQNGYLPMLDVFNKYNTGLHFEDYLPDHLIAFNVGFIKFNNYHTKNLFLNRYDQMKEFYLTNIEPYESIFKEGSISSLIVCQFYFGSLAEYHGVDFRLVYDKRSKYPYDHYLGPKKYESYTKARVEYILTDNREPLL